MRKSFAYFLGRSDALRRSVNTHVWEKPKDPQQYQRGYNSVTQQDRETFDFLNDEIVKLQDRIKVLREAAKKLEQGDGIRRPVQR